MLKKLLLAMAAVLVTFLGFVATRPDAYRVERSSEIAAPATAVFAAVSDFKNFPEWSPWETRDPNMKRTLSTPSAGAGATYAWEGNKDVGKGKMTFTEVTAPARVREKLEFLEPFPSVADVAFDLSAAAGGTKITWAMEGKHTFVGKIFGLFMDMDKMIGKDFEEGLANLKRVVESRPALEPTAPAPAPAAAPGAAPASPGVAPAP
jgi:uncharacterized protein YndB with AHSA1/START domain